MSRSGYSDDGDYDQWQNIMWRGSVASAIRGKRGQAFLRELLAALDALPEKRLVRNSFEASGEVCALGAIGRARGLDMTRLNAVIEDDEEEYGYGSKVPKVASEAFGIAKAMAAEIMYWNDDCWTSHYDEAPEKRWHRMRKWVAEQIKPTMTAPGEREE